MDIGCLLFPFLSIVIKEGCTTSSNRFFLNMIGEGGENVKNLALSVQCGGLVFESDQRIDGQKRQCTHRYHERVSRRGSVEIAAQVRRDERCHHAAGLGD